MAYGQYGQITVRRDLEHRLRQAVDTDRQANQRFTGTLQRHAIRGQNRQDHKHAKHAQGEYVPKPQVARSSPGVILLSFITTSI